MNMRKDALAGASEIVLAVEQISAEESGVNTVGTVGYLRVTPGVMNVVPGKVELGIDIRDVNMKDKTRAVGAICKKIDQVAAKRELNISYERLCNDQPVDLANKIIETLEQSASRAELPFIKMPSGAGHDAMNMTKITDVGMIFIPSVGGVSHNIEEFSRMDDICTGTELLLEATLQLSQE